MIVVCSIQQTNIIIYIMHFTNIVRGITIIVKITNVTNESDAECRRQDSNLRPFAFLANTLPIELSMTLCTTLFVTIA